jgi:transglutaminase-like putative cysteine protease
LVILYQSIGVLLWTIFLLFYYLFLLLYSQIGEVWESLKEGIGLTLLALPMIILLFLFFPRVGLVNARFGIRGGEILTGFSGIVETSSQKVIKSRRPVFEVEFLNRIPTHLYFRGAVFYRYLHGEWIPGGREPKERLEKVGEIIQYRLKLYPTGQKVIFGLDLPIEAPPHSTLTPYYTIQNRKPLFSTQLFLLNSAVKYKLMPEKIPADALRYNPNTNLLTQRLVTPLRKISDPDRRVERLIQLFANQKIEYTLSPPKFDPSNLVDQLLFQTKKGYCVHLATALALMARMAGIPSRLVTGYLGSRNSLIKNYLLVREEDAHGWVELYTPRRGWFRVDPTQFVRHTPQREEERGNLYLSYLQFIVEKWVLHYNYITQTHLLSRLKNPNFLIKFLLGLGIVGIGALLFWYRLFRRRRQLPPEERLIKSVENWLAKRGVVRKRGETRHHFFQRVAGGEEINRLYHRIKYGEERELLPDLKRAIEKFKREMKK